MHITPKLAAGLALLVLGACGNDTLVQHAEPLETPPRDLTTLPQVINPAIAFKSNDLALALSSDALTMVAPVHDHDSDVWSVFVQLDKQAADDFFALTSEIEGETLAVLIDDQTVSTPLLDTAIYSGGFVFEVENGAVATDVVAGLQAKMAMPFAWAAQKDAVWRPERRAQRDI